MSGKQVGKGLHLGSDPFDDHSVTRHARIVARGAPHLVESAVQPVAGPPTGVVGHPSRDPRRHVFGEGTYGGSVASLGPGAVAWAPWALCRSGLAVAVRQTGVVGVIDWALRDRWTGRIVVAQ